MNPSDFTLFTRALPEPHLLVDSTGLILAGNTAASQLFERPAAALRGVSLSSLVQTPGGDVLGFLAAAAASGQFVPGRFDLAEGGGASSYPVAAGVVRPADGGKPAWVMVRIGTSDQGNPFLLLNRKIEELTAEIRRRMDLEEERTRLLNSEREARAQAEEASRLKDDFLATLSHELRTPLNAIVGWVSILREGVVGPDRHAVALETIDRAARAQAQLVEDLLDLSRIVGGQVRLNVQAVNVADVVARAVETVRPTADAKGVRIDAVLDPRSGPVSGDADRLQQVVWNLLTNAIKFSKQRGRVEVRVERANSHVDIIVADEGEGIPADFLPHVFDRFRQADSSRSRTHGGVGLGLSIVQQLVEAHAGLIHAESAGPGQGATFTVILPLQIYQPPPSVASERVHPLVPSSPSGEDLPPADALAGVDVLVVEDNADSRQVLTTILEGYGARVRAVPTAREARARIRDELPDLILADIELPGEDGLTFVRKLRAGTPDDGVSVPAIAVTAFARRVDRLRALDAGFQMHLAKPVEPAELVTTIRAVLGAPGQPDQPGSSAVEPE